MCINPLKGQCPSHIETSRMKALIWKLIDWFLHKTLIVKVLKTLPNIDDRTFYKINPIIDVWQGPKYNNEKKLCLNCFIVQSSVTEIVSRRCFVKKVFLKILQTCARVFFLIKYIHLLKERLWHRFFPASFAKFLRAPFYRKPPVAASGVTNMLRTNVENRIKNSQL